MISRVYGSWEADMVLLTEDASFTTESYKHGPPDGGRSRFAQVHLFDHTHAPAPNTPVVERVGALK